MILGLSSLCPFVGVFGLLAGSLFVRSVVPPPFLSVVLVCRSVGCCWSTVLFSVHPCTSLSVFAPKCFQPGPGGFPWVFQGSLTRDGIFGEIVGPMASTARLLFAAYVGRAGCLYGSEVFSANDTRMAIVAAVYRKGERGGWCSFCHSRKCGRHSLNLFCHPESLGVSGAGFVLPSPIDTSLQRNSLQNFADVEMAPLFISFPRDFQF